MKTFLFTLALAVAVIGGAVAVSDFTGTPAHACGNNDGCAKPQCTGSNC